MCGNLGRHHGIKVIGAYENQVRVRGNIEFIGSQPAQGNYRQTCGFQFITALRDGQGGPDGRIGSTRRFQQRIKDTAGVEDIRNPQNENPAAIVLAQKHHFFRVTVFCSGQKLQRRIRNLHAVFGSEVEPLLLRRMKMQRRVF